MPLRDGHEAFDPRLDRIYQLDWRSLNYAVGSRLIARGAPIYRPRSYTWSVDHWFDQGQEGACVGFAFTHELAAKPQVIAGLSDRFAREKVYWEAQKIDPWEGGAYPGAAPQYEGTSVLAGAQVVQRLGYYDSYHWGITIQEVAQGLAYFGPCVLGLNWYEGMFWPDKGGFLHPTGRIMGGHAILAHSIKVVYKSPWARLRWWGRTWQDVDFDRSYVVLWNSWGQSWGDQGRAKLSLTNLNLLLQQQGDALFPQRAEGRI